mgnify:CR=1 FL=1
MNFSLISLQSFSENNEKQVKDIKIIIAELHRSREIFECNEHRRLPSVLAVLFTSQLRDISGNGVRLLSSRNIFEKLCAYIDSNLNYKICYAYISPYFLFQIFEAIIALVMLIFIHKDSIRKRIFCKGKIEIDPSQEDTKLNLQTIENTDNIPK